MQVKEMHGRVKLKQDCFKGILFGLLQNGNIPLINFNFGPCVLFAGRWGGVFGNDHLSDDQCRALLVVKP